MVTPPIFPDPAGGLAREEALLDLPGEDPPVLTFWRASAGVVIGKNQIPGREADLGWIARAGIRLARRASGGGAVYHDAGNLNWSFCLSRRAYQAEAVTNLCLQALRRIGVPAEAVGSSSLVSQGAKVSGMAFAYRRERVLHHGTLLGDADLGQLRRALRPLTADWNTHAVASQPMPVRNIGAPNLARFQEALAHQFECAWPEGRLSVPGAGTAPAGVLEAEARHGHPDWLFGRTPRFSWTCRVETPDGTAHQLQASVEHGRIASAEVRSGAGPARRVPPGEWFCAEAFAAPGTPLNAALEALGADPGR